MNKIKKRLTLVLTVITILAICVTSFALFTDRMVAKTEVTAGTLDLNLTESWENDNSTVAAAFLPGTGIKLNYTITNNGNLATDVRETFAISFDKALTSGSHEFSLYKASDVTVDSKGYVSIKSGATPLTCNYAPYNDVNTGTTKYKLTYSPSEYTLNGDSSLTGFETVSGVTSNAKSSGYVLVFNTNADNDFQGVNVIIDFMAQGLQHNNTGDDTWEDAKVLIETTFGGEKIDVVPNLN